MVLSRSGAGRDIVDAYEHADCQARANARGLRSSTRMQRCRDARFLDPRKTHRGWRGWPAFEFALTDFL
jgi:hypothetical protein